jgi:aminoglycoside phosphotransferase (APT) family kinase protein
MRVESLQAFLEVVEPERSARVLDVTQVPGGYSRQTFLSYVEWADGQTETLVLRQDPRSDEVFISDRGREWTVLNTIHQSRALATAKPRYYDATGEYLGTPTIVSEFIPDAASFQAVLQSHPDLARARREFIEMVATVHKTPLSDIEGGLAKPSSWDAHIESLLAVFEGILAKQAAVGESDPLLRYVLLKLRANLPPAVPLTLVHGDCQPGNFLVREGQAPVVIDWEFAEIGDPRQDLGYYLVIPMPPHLYHGDPAAFCAEYREATGLTEDQVNPQTIASFLMLGQGRLFAMELDAAEAIARGEDRGALGLYLVGAIPDVRRTYLDICLTLPMPEVIA